MLNISSNSPHEVVYTLHICKHLAVCTTIYDSCHFDIISNRSGLSVKWNGAAELNGRFREIKLRMNIEGLP